MTGLLLFSTSGSPGPNPGGMCLCGCGDPAPIAKLTDRRKGNVKGFPARYCPGHHSRTLKSAGAGPNPTGLCMCGCGVQTPLAATSDAGRGLVAGLPVRYLSGHNGREGPEDYRVDPETGCWIWLRFINHLGYGRAKDNGRARQAHRVIYERRYGPVPRELHLDHLCRNRACVNPDHMEPVTPAENSRRGNSTKLVAHEVCEIRASGETAVALAARFRVAPATIDDIRSGRTWAGIR